jgi:farnesyl-diphosphate farnesyltransferase
MAMAVWDDLLQKTSRTFALAIPFLPEPARLQVTIAYLLFRIADTLEDASNWPRAERLRALRDLSEVLERRSCEVAAPLSMRWVAARPCDHRGYLELLGELPSLFAELEALDPGPREAICRHVLRTIGGMCDFLERGDEHGHYQIDDEDMLRRYCYTVAGIVGELLTELFTCSTPQLRAVVPVLVENASAFGEGLQLVNILKDALADAGDGRRYLPGGADHRQRIIALARKDLDAAATYVLTLQTAGAPRGMVAFTALSVILGRKTLDGIEHAGVGAKLGRDAVMETTLKLRQALETDEPAL